MYRLVARAHTDDDKLSTADEWLGGEVISTA